MQSVVETPAFLASAAAVGIDDGEQTAIVNFFATNPDYGDIMPGTGGARKGRFSGRGKGKSGGFRVISFYAGTDIPVFLLYVYSKGARDNLSKAERNELKIMLTELPKSYRAMMKKRSRRGR
jgi:hypothetical protein